MGLFSCSIPPWFVLSNNLSTINTRAIWLCLGAFLSSPASSVQFHWPLFSLYPPLATRHSPLPPTTLPRWLLPDTDTRFVKDRTGSDLHEQPLYIQYVTEPSDSCSENPGGGLAAKRDNPPNPPMLDGRCKNAQVGGVLPWDEARSDG